MAKPKFNFIYNDDVELGFGKGYYMFIQGIANENKGQDLFTTYYPLIETKNVDFVSVGLLNEIRHNTEMGWVYDKYYHVDLTKHFAKGKRFKNRRTYGAVQNTTGVMYKITYHYMHYIPSEIVSMLVPESLLNKTKEALAKDSSILIDSIEEN